MAKALWKAASGLPPTMGGPGADVGEELLQGHGASFIYFIYFVYWDLSGRVWGGRALEATQDRARRRALGAAG